jgi:hypothetical protein
MNQSISQNNCQISQNNCQISQNNCQNNQKNIFYSIAIAYGCVMLNNFLLSKNYIARNLRIDN